MEGGTDGWRRERVGGRVKDREGRREGEQMEGRRESGRNRWKEGRREGE